MKRAYVLIRTVPGKAETLAEALRCKPEIIAADVVSGPHDVIAVVEGKNANTVARATLVDIPALEGVSHTTTCLVQSSEAEQCCVQRGWGRRPESDNKSKGGGL